MRLFTLSATSRFGKGKWSRMYSIAASHKSIFERIVGKEHVLSTDMSNYTTDWTMSYFGGSLVCFPKTTDEVSRVLKYCNENKIGVVPQGGNTGLVGGAVGTERGELILSTKRMNKIIDIDSSAGVVTCEAGCVLEWLNAQVGEKGFTFPLDLAAKGSCMIGGNVATNAGGLRVIKYGSLQGNVLGLEVVLADGTIVDMNRTLRKDNCGLHSKHLFIGSEGTLGVITKVSVLLATKPSFSCVVFAKLSSFSEVGVMLGTARRMLGDTLTAFEFIDRNAIDAVRRAYPHILHSVQGSVLPTAGRVGDKNEHEEGVLGEVAVLIECTGTNTELDQQRVDAFAEEIVESGLAQDAVLSLNSEQEQGLWDIRENLTVSMSQLARSSNPLYSPSSTAPSTTISPRISLPAGTALTARLFKYDLSVRLPHTAALLKELKQRVQKAGFRLKGAPDPSSSAIDAKATTDSVDLTSLLSACELEFCNYGHIADQNIHLNILSAVRTVQGAGRQQGQDGVEAFQVGVLRTPQQRKYLRNNNENIANTATAGAGPVGDREGSGGGADGGVIRAVRMPVKGSGGSCGGAEVFIEDECMVEYTALLRAELNKHVFDLTLAYGGSISAEHGVGAQKAFAMPWARSPAELELMRSIKTALDPNYILNPGKVLSI